MAYMKVREQTLFLVEVIYKSSVQSLHQFKKNDEWLKWPSGSVWESQAYQLNQTVQLQDVNSANERIAYK